jgi:hypothetical protein
MCFCPENLPPPTAEMARCRLILQLLAAGLFMVALFAMVAGEMFFILYGLMLAYLLYISWATFRFELVLYFFFISGLESIMTWVQMVGM